MPPGLEADVRSIEEQLSAASPWLAYCPSDTCPDNNRVLPDGSVRFFDFEGSGWRNAATEAAYCRAPFCTCWCVAALPDGMTAAMEASFLDAFRPPDIENFRATIALAAIAWTLTFPTVRRFIASGGPVGPPGRTPCDRRQYIVLRLATTASEETRLPALAELASDLLVAVANRWLEAALLPPYPAFR